MSNLRQYFNSEGRPIALLELVREEPEWAANQIRSRDEAEAAFESMADDLVANSFEVERLTAERQADRVALENLHHEIGLDLPDEGMAILQLVGNLLAASHERDAAQIAGLTAELEQLRPAHARAGELIGRLRAEIAEATRMMEHASRERDDARKERDELQHRLHAERENIRMVELREQAVAAELDHLKAECVENNITPPNMTETMAFHAELSLATNCATDWHNWRAMLSVLTAERDAALATLAQIAGKKLDWVPSTTVLSLDAALERAAERLLKAHAILAENPDWPAAKDRVDQCESEVARLEAQRKHTP